MISKIDLVIPVYGEAPFLEETIRSCESSLGVTFNLIWALDRPSAKVRRIIEDFSTTRSYSKVVLSHTPGIVAALNLAIDSGQAEYIARLDSDDVMESNRLQLQSQYLDTTMEVGVVGTQMTLIDESNKRLGVTKYPRNHEQIIALLEFQNCIGHPSVMFRRSTFEKAGGYRSQFSGAEDYDLWLRIAEFAKLHNLVEPLTRYRISSFQFTKRKESNQGVVETAVRLASLGYFPKGNDSVNSEHTDLELSNKRLLDHLKDTDHAAYRKHKAIHLVNRAYLLKSRSKRYSSGVYYLVLAFLLSPLKILKYLSIKFLGLN